jgi:hypothetical protein
MLAPKPPDRISLIKVAPARQVVVKIVARNQKDNSKTAGLTGQVAENRMNSSSRIKIRINSDLFGIISATK